MESWSRRGFLLGGTSLPLLHACVSPSAAPALQVTCTSEFEAQEYIWVTWGENGFLGGPPMTDSVLPLIREIAPEVPVRILYNEWLSWIEQSQSDEPLRTAEDVRARISGRLAEEGVDLSRIEFIRSDTLFGAVQDPGPVFTRLGPGKLAIADFASRHFKPETGSFDRRLVAPFGIPAVSSSVKSDGGNRQCNGRGVMMIGGAFARENNPDLTQAELEAEFCRVQGVEKVIWLEHGPREEDNGLLEDGRWGIGTGGHIDEFCRFVDERTILLAEVPEAERDLSPIHAITHQRMEENFAILSAATDIDGQPFRILRVPTPHHMTSSIRYEDFGPFEVYWFDDPQPGMTFEFYLPGSYMNFVIANGVVITSKYWRDGMDEKFRIRDEEGRLALQAAFPDRRVVQVYATPLLHDGAGLHCYTRNQPYAEKRPYIPAG